ncbi:hypothetical protein D3C75_1248750 [compost metagenome]
MQEGFHVLAPAHPVVKFFGVTHLVVIQILQQIEGEVFHLLPAGGIDLLQPFLEFIANVIAVYCLVADDQSDQIGGVGQFGAA